MTTTFTVCRPVRQRPGGPPLTGTTRVRGVPFQVRGYVDPGRRLRLELEPERKATAWSQEDGRMLLRRVIADGRERFVGEWDGLGSRWSVVAEVRHPPVVEAGAVPGSESWYLSCNLEQKWA